MFYETSLDTRRIICDVIPLDYPLMTSELDLCCVRNLLVCKLEFLVSVQPDSSTKMRVLLQRNHCSCPLSLAHIPVECDI